MLVDNETVNPVQIAEGGAGIDSIIINAYIYQNPGWNEEGFPEVGRGECCTGPIACCFYKWRSQRCSRQGTAFAGIGELLMFPLIQRYIVVFALLALTACGFDRQEKKGSQAADNLYSTDKDDQEMNRAMATAKRTFPRFDSAFSSGRYDRDQFSIKVRFAAPGGNEYIWLTEIQKSNGHYIGIVSDTPRATTWVRLGEKWEIPDQDIVDWLYTKDSIAHGAYTLRLILSRMSKDERAEAELGFPYKIED
jgi:uncharacterized protein YegJ (DUF2314 family)